MEEFWWNEVKEALFHYLDRESEEYSRVIMQLSFDNLLDCLMPCLLYMGMFPEDARIPVSKLISLWIAEEFMQIESGRLMEEAAEGYLMDLISSNVVMVLKREFNGKVKYCQVHDVVLHFCLEKNSEEKFMRAVKGHYSQLQTFEWKESRMSFSFSKDLSEFASLTRNPFHHQHLRSLITTNQAESYCWNPFRQVSEVRLLKVLDLSSCAVKALSSVTLKPLIHLKYLTVSTKEFDFHPETHLSHLETLIVEDLSMFMVVPASFWKMEKLRHVEIGEAELDLKWENNMEGMFEESSKLKNLRILKRVVIHEGDRVDMLSRQCSNLQELDIIFLDKDSAEICFKLESLSQLQIIRLSLVMRTQIGSVIPFIARLPSLEYLQLRGMLQYLTKIGQLEKWCLGDITFHKLRFIF